MQSLLIYKINIMETIFAKDAPAAVGPFSHAMVSNGIFYCSGQIGINPKNMQLEGKSIEEQASKVFENVKSVLASKELTLADVAVGFQALKAALMSPVRCLRTE